MSATPRGGVGAALLAGIQTGVIAGLGVVAYQALGSSLAGGTVWAVPAQTGAAVFGREVYRDGVAAAALAGLSAQLFACGLVGALFGVAARHPWALRRIALLGPLTAMAWYYLAYEILLPRFGPGRHAFIAPRASLVLAHLVFGLLLGLYPRFRRRISAAP